MIVALVDEENPPWFFKNKEGILEGSEIELSRAIAKELGVRVRFDQTATSYNAIADVVGSGKADIALTYLARTLRRSQKVAYTQPYGFFSQALLLNQLAYARLKVDGIESPSIFQKLNQADALIVVENGSSYLSWGLKMFPKATFYLVPKWDEHFASKLRKGEVTAAFGGSFSIRKFMIGTPDLKAFTQPILLKDRPGNVHAAVDPKKPNFLRWVNEYISEKRIRITTDFLFKKYKDLGLTPNI